MMELLKYYDTSVHYHLRKAYVVTNALSRVFMESMFYTDDGKKEWARKVHQLTRLGARLNEAD